MAGDIYAPNQQWVDAYALSGITVGKALVIQNKATTPVLVLESAAQPASTSAAGFELGAREAVEVSVDSVGVWVRSVLGPARLFVQEA
ncbi:hypothetical protein D9M69_285300 [compost metagenome]